MISDRFFFIFHFNRNFAIFIGIFLINLDFDYNYGHYRNCCRRPRAVSLRWATVTGQTTLEFSSRVKGMSLTARTDDDPWISAAPAAALGQLAKI